MNLKYFIVRDSQIIGIRLEEDGKFYDAYIEKFKGIEQLKLMNLGYLRSIRSYTDEFITADELLNGKKAVFLNNDDINIQNINQVFCRPNTDTDITLDFQREAELDMFDWYYNHTNKVLYVEGARQTGKTYAINKFIEKVWDTDGVYKINLMADSVKNALAAFRSRPFAKVKSGRIKSFLEEFAEFYFEDFDIETAKVLYVDEVQEDAGIYNTLREFAREEKCRLIVSGSYLNIVSNAALGNNTLKPPAGGNYPITIYSLSFIEFLQANGIINSQVLFKSANEYSDEDHELFDKVQKLYHIYLTIGGYPDVVKTYIKSKSTEQAMTVLRTLIHDYFSESAPYLALCRPTVEFESTFTAILEIMTNNNRYKLKDIAVEIKNAFKRKKKSVSETDICSTLFWLTSGGFLKSIKQYRNTTFNDYSDNQRYYFNDLGVVNYIAEQSNIPESVLNGYLAENFAFLQIAEAFPVMIPTIGYLDISKDKDLGNAELDFVYKDMNKKGMAGIEVKYKNSAAKSLIKIRKSGMLKTSVKAVDAKTNLSTQTIPVFCIRFYCLLDKL